ncbi:MAG: hypothetical protein OEY58_22155 [Gammaproteobacteria bacterium]|nr:hypothetical protein [Gammaproteobacteria bacterium]
MVVSSNIPTISWEENFSYDDERRVATLILEALRSARGERISDEPMLFFFIPTPLAYDKAELEMVEGYHKATGEQLRHIAFPRGKAYVVASPDQFLQLVPLTFKLGPPELTFILSQCGLDLSSSEQSLSDHIVDALAKDSSADGCYAGLHFDSGDLVELF